MRFSCPKSCKDSEISQARSKIVKHGSYYRTSDGQWIQRYRCMSCKVNFSAATFSVCFRQKKRQKNQMLRRLFSRAVSQRGAAKILNIDRKTSVRKFRFLAARSEISFNQNNQARPKAEEIEFDDMETYEHTKCKPLSITIAVESKTRRILGFEVSTMKAKGLLTHKARKYCPRQDTRTKGRRRLFAKIHPLIREGCTIKSDQNPHYERDIRKYFPKSLYKQYKGQRGSSTGQGELKKIKFDPLFSLNHTCAMLRANVSRLFRKTWCTTKRPDQLRAHLMIYAEYHNSQLTQN